MQTKATYVISTGKADEERLAILNRLCNPYTERFCMYLPVLTGKTILDIGCGTGIISCYWAKQVGPEGRVVGVDISHEQLEIAKQNAAQAGLKNIEFIALNAHDLDHLKEQFDLVYCRFLLMHLADTEILLKKIQGHIKPRGYLFCEEVSSFEAYFADPDSQAFQDWKGLTLKLPLINHTDFYIGKHLHSSFRKLNIDIVHSELCQPIVHEERDKGYFYLPYTESLKQKFVDKNLATMEEINQIIDALKLEMINKPWISGVIQYMQILGQKSVKQFAE